MAQGAKKTAKKKAADPYALALAARIAKAFKRYNAEAEHGREISQDELGVRVAKRLRMPAPFSQAAVSRWMSPTNPATPDNPTLEAIADVLKADRALLAFGDPVKRKAPDPRKQTTGEDEGQREA